MRTLKRNQVIIFVVALMLMTAGYLNYDARNRDIATSVNVIEENQVAGIGDAKLVSNNDVIENIDEVNQMIQNQNTNVSSMENGIDTTINTAAKITDEYFTTSRLGRDTMYSQMIESYQKILENQSISQEQKTIATQEIANINNVKNAIMISENLIKTKGFSDVIIFVNDKSINVIIQADNLEADKIAQVQNIIAREMKAEIENIHISNK